MGVWMGALAVLAALFCLVQAVYFALMYCAWPPSIPSDGKTRRAMAAALAERNPSVVYDLGSGFGHLVFDVARACPGAGVRGIEKFPMPFYVARFRERIRRLLRRPGNPSFIKGDFFSRDFSDADAVLCFLLRGKMMERVKDEIWKQLKPGAVFISNGAPLPGVTFAKEVRVEQVIGVRSVYVYVKT